MVHDTFTQTPLYDVSRIFDEENQRPKEQWWMRLQPLARMLAQPSAEQTATTVSEAEQHG